MDIKLDNNHDLDFSSNTMKLTSTFSEEVGQRVKIALLYRKGEWFANVERGVPYASQVFSKKEQLKTVEAFLRPYIEDVEGVRRVIRFTTNIVNRKLTVAVLIETTESTTISVEA